MCTYNITVNESALKRMHPTFTRESFGEWLQRHVDDLVEDMTSEVHSDSPIAYSEEEMVPIAEERLHRLDTRETTTIPGEQVYALIRARYGFNG